MENTPETTRHFESFELIVAILLGLGAVGAALTSYQNGKWNYAANVAYSESSTLTVEASTIFNFAVTVISADYAMDVQARQLLLNAATARDPQAGKRDLQLANYVYKHRMSDDGYAALGLPRQYRPAEGQTTPDMPMELLMPALQRDLDTKYLKKMVDPATRKFSEAEKKSAEGRRAGDEGDKFSQIGLFYSISLFVTGVALVFKTHIKWGFVGLGFVVFAFATVRLFLVPWA